jgi:hypothetical protein
MPSRRHADAELAHLYDQVVAATARTNEAGISHEEWAACCDDCDALAFRASVRGRPRLWSLTAQHRV